jgi:glycosyltransferase involved in cell wall biosynthesis
VKILLVNSEPRLRGGEHQTLALAEGLSARGCDVLVTLRTGSALAERIPAGIGVRSFRFEQPPLSTPIGIGRLIRNWGPDIIHAQTSKAHTHCWIARWLVSDPPPFIVSRRVAFDISAPLRYRPKYRRGVTHYVPISRAAAESLRRAGVPEEKMTVIPSGVDVGRFRNGDPDTGLLRQWGIGAGRTLIGTVAAYTPEKGHRVLIDAAGIVSRDDPRCCFVCVGEGPEEQALRRQINDGGLTEQVKLVPLDRPLESVLPLFDIYVLPSIEEGLSTALIAALAAGLPVVATATGGIPEVVREGSGLLVPPGDHRALARTVAGLLGDGALREQLARSGAQRALAFDIETTVERSLELYRAIVERGSR